MDLLKDGIHLRAYANKDPLIEYKKESFDLFQNLIIRIQENVTRKVFTTYILSQAQVKSMLENANMSHDELNAYLHAQEVIAQNQGGNHPMPPEAMADGPKLKPIKVEIKVGRNDPCPCGSGKKYKKCCGKMEFQGSDD
jgi:preprotein translocase subunit SecA